MTGMIVIDPREITLASTNVTPNSEPEWSEAATYGLGETVQVTTSTPHTVYRSTRGNNTGRNPADHLEPVVEIGSSSTSITIGDGDHTLITQAGLSFSAGMIVKITKTATPNTVNMTAEVTAYNSGTGALEVTVYSTAGAGAHASWTITSEDEIGFWEEDGSTNQYAMFDKYINTQTEFLEEIDVKLNVSRVDHVSLFGLEGKLVELFLWDSTETELLWSSEIDLVYGAAIVSGISDWYEYFFGEFSSREDASAQLDVVTYEGILRIRITADAGEQAKCGNIIPGRAYDIGIVTYGASAGIVDFSVKDTDDLGRVSISQGYWAKRNTVTLTVMNYKLDATYKVLAGLRGVPTAWSANNSGVEYESFVIFGIFTDFEITLSGHTKSVCTLEIEGLV